jgi:hypothetical protein
LPIAPPVKPFRRPGCWWLGLELVLLVVLVDSLTVARDGE